ncbi:MAG TPA: metalloregulator ArsR/SmtB family transcription factor [Candidatus Methanofastidiosa archaeon]|nr:metalloregulator ArsR/SmtB family transcription factor [Candidatus Methanofastidiosa archaeon]
MNERDAAEIFKAMADANRLKILEFLLDGERCVCEIYPYIGTSQSNVSQHLKVLRNAGMIDFRKDGKKIIYFITSPEIFALIENVKKML